MSTSFESTGTPIASMLSGTSPIRRCTMSMSWIIRSRTTSTSVARARIRAHAVDLDEAGPSDPVAHRAQGAR